MRKKLSLKVISICFEDLFIIIYDEGIIEVC